MEVQQRNSLCSYLKQAKMSFLFPFFCKTGEQEGCKSPAVVGGAGGCWYQWEGERCRRVNMVQILCTHICIWKNDTC
jgi:hypothetical protein